MSSQIDVNLVQQYSANFFMLSQQRGSVLRGSVRNETIKAKAAFYDRIGKMDAQPKAGRHSNTPQTDTPHSRRMLTTADFEIADLLDDQDKIKMLGDPQNEYLMAQVWGHGRKIDDIIIAAAIGTARAGEAGADSVVLPNSQKVFSEVGGALGGMNVETLRKIVAKFDLADIDPSLQRNIVVDAISKQYLLADTTLTSADYNTVKALVNGEIDTFMGLKFHKSQRLLTQDTALSGTTGTGVVGAGAIALINARRCFAWVSPGVIYGVGQDIKADISVRNDKSLSTQVYTCMSSGAVRMAEEMVVEALVKAT